MARVGISTACFYPCEVYDSLKNVIGLASPVTEVFMNSFSEMAPEKLRELRGLAESSGTEIVSFHPFISAADHLFLFSGYKYRVDDGIEIYKHFFDAAAYLGAKMLVFHGERSRPEKSGISALPEGMLLEVYGRLLDEAKKTGVVFAQESVTAFRSEERALIDFLAKNFDDIRFTLDIKQILRAKKSLPEMMDAMGERIVQVHLNNFKNGVCTLPFDGEVDMRELKSSLDSLSYGGDFCIEVYRDNFGNPHELKAAMERAAEIF